MNLVYIILIVAVIIFGFWLIQYSQFRNEEKKRQWELKRITKKEISPIRLRAYERLSLLLQRTEPEAMLMNEGTPVYEISHDISGKYTMLDLQRELLRTVRLEFDHNMSQQIYVSDEVWDRIILARDEMGGFINTIAIQMKPGSTPMEYAKALLTAYVSNGETPHQKALYELKEEARRLIEN